MIRVKQLKPEEIRAFYEQYKSNIGIARQLENDLLKPQTQKESWIALLKHKSLLMRNLYAENEATIERFIRPFLDGREEITQEYAKVFLEEIILFLEEGISDSLITFDMLELLSKFYEKNPDPQAWIACLYYKAYSEQYLTGRLHLERAHQTYQQVLLWKDKYFELSNPKVRILLLWAMYHSLNCLLHSEPISLEAIFKELDDMIEFWNCKEIRKLDGIRFAFDDLMRQIHCNLCHVSRYLKPDSSKELRSRIYREMDGLYNILYQECKGHTENMNNIVYFNYFRSLKERKLITPDEYFERIYAYYHTLQRPENWKEDSFFHSVYFATMLNFMPEIIRAVDETSYPKKLKQQRKEMLLKELLRFYEGLPLHNGDSMINQIIFKEVREALQFWNDYDKVIHVLLHITVYRNIITSIHSIMTSRLAEQIMQSILKYHPEYCIGCLGTQTVEEVKAKAKEILQFAGEAAMCHDIGKIAYSDLVNLQTRRITDAEFMVLTEHPMAGYRFLRDIPILSKFKDVALGHHKYYDSTGGYPVEFNNISSSDRFFIDLITICDCTDAATDVLGRNYAKGKSFPAVLEELRREEGYRYSPKLVEAIAEDEALSARLSKLTTSGRIEVFYHVYQDHIVSHQDKYIL